MCDVLQTAALDLDSLGLSSRSESRHLAPRGEVGHVVITHGISKDIVQRCHTWCNLRCHLRGDLGRAVLATHVRRRLATLPLLRCRFASRLRLFPKHSLLRFTSALARLFKFIL